MTDPVGQLLVSNALSNAVVLMHVCIVQDASRSLSHQPQFEVPGLKEAMAERRHSTAARGAGEALIVMTRWQQDNGHAGFVFSFRCSSRPRGGYGDLMLQLSSLYRVGQAKQCQS